SIQQEFHTAGSIKQEFHTALQGIAGLIVYNEAYERENSIRVGIKWKVGHFFYFCLLCFFMLFYSWCSVYGSVVSIIPT
ncbi:MAG: hypothetical protein FWD43_06230, partial [Coriobacteriia bacterium]|nr:hypothetical protein [Coriobacteriia bacterium]